MKIAIHGLLVIGLVLTGCAVTETGDTPETETVQPQSGANDAEIESAIRAALQDDELLTNSNIQVDARNGVVVLSGSVPSGRAMNRAISLARSVPGVRRLDLQQLRLP